MSHLSDIGFAANDNEAFSALVEKAYQQANLVKAEQGAYFHYTDQSGAEMWIHLDKDNVLSGVNPHFRGASRQTVALTNFVQVSNNQLEGAFYCWAEPNDSGEGTYPFVFEVPNINALGRLNLPQTLDIQLAAFAEEIFYCGSEAEFSKDKQDDIAWATKSFVPTGLFSLENQSNDAINESASGMFSGVIEQVEERQNSLTEQRFYWLLVETLGGQVDVVADTQFFTNPPSIGEVIHGQFWLSAHILSIPQIIKPKKNGFLRRMFGRV